MKETLKDMWNELDKTYRFVCIILIINVTLVGFGGIVFVHYISLISEMAYNVALIMLLIIILIVSICNFIVMTRLSDRLNTKNEI